MSPTPLGGRRFLVVGLGVTGRAMAAALVARGLAVVAVDDRAEVDAPDGLEVHAAPDEARLVALVGSVDVVLPSPGVPDHHPVFAAAAAAGLPVASEFDLAAAWDARPLLAVTGTNGKTTVCDLTAAMCEASGLRAPVVGNAETPLVAAIDDPGPDLFVVEASSFRLAHSRRFRPSVATWLNFAPDHLDAHRDLAAYEAAKASIWSDPAVGLAVANGDDPVVMRNVNPSVRTETFSIVARADWWLDGDVLRTPGGERLVGVAELWRAHPFDVADSLAAAATAVGGGAGLEGIEHALRRFVPGAHRMELLGERDGVRWVDDSKSTTPHSTLAAVRAHPSVVLIAGGRNKGLDLSVLADAADHLRAVVAIGEAAPEVADAFAGRVEVAVADSMEDAVHHAGRLARQGDVVLLSPACASFDWYGSYHERGSDFRARVRSRVGIG